jgi:4-diphosphocytidyl-2-C-methyl-D-erythritol kinase
MWIERQADAVMAWAPAKVNLFLEVLARRADGYHEIATLMMAVSLYDTLEFKEDSSGTIQVESDLPTLPTGPANLIHKAATLLRQRAGITRGMRVQVRKRIPLQAGLGGGSSDAAATLAALNRLWQLGLAGTELDALGTQLGSDVPFFLSGPAAWCTGRGERTEPMTLGQPLWVVLACPNEGQSTAEVYKEVRVPEHYQTGAEIRQAAQSGEIDAIGRGMFNRLQPVAEKLCPAVGILAKRVADLHPTGTLMSGSGSAVFALCRDRSEAVRIAHQLRSGTEDGSSPRVFMVRSCS